MCIYIYYYVVIIIYSDAIEELCSNILRCVLSVKEYALQPVFIIGQSINQSSLFSAKYDIHIQHVKTIAIKYNNGYDLILLCTLTKKMPLITKCTNIYKFMFLH